MHQNPCINAVSFFLFSFASFFVSSRLQSTTWQQNNFDTNEKKKPYNQPYHPTTSLQKILPYPRSLPASRLCPQLLLLPALIHHAAAAATNYFRCCCCHTLCCCCCLRYCRQFSLSPLHPPPNVCHALFTSFFGTGTTQFYFDGCCYSDGSFLLYFSNPFS